MGSTGIIDSKCWMIDGVQLNSPQSGRHYVPALLYLSSFPSLMGEMASTAVTSVTNNKISLNTRSNHVESRLIGCLPIFWRVSFLTLLFS